MERRLAAILAADMVGYSRLMEADEVGTLERQRTHRSELINPAFKEFHGRIVKEIGDGILVEFPSVVEAVECAVKIQGALPKREAHLPEERRISYRIGINLGDIIVEGDDIHGDGVNVAARLEALAEPGGICISGAAYDTVRVSRKFGFQSLGEVQVKNIERPIRAYRVSGDPLRSGDVISTPRHRINRRLWAALGLVAVLFIAAGGWWWMHPGTDGDASKSLSLAVSDKPRLAVLPFDDYGGNDTTARLSKGLTEDIITDLARFPEFEVLSRNSTEKYENKAVDPREIRNELGADFLLEGSIQRDKDRYRITAQLIDTSDNQHIWSERWDRQSEAVFNIQTEIAEVVANRLGGGAGLIQQAGREQARRKRPSNLDAYELYLLGSEKLEAASRDGIREAIELLQKAVEIDPQLARAWVELYHAHNISRYFGTDKEAAQAKAAAAAKEAVKLDPGDAEAHSALAMAYADSGEFEKAKKEFETSLRMAPNAFEILAFYASWAGSLGEPELGVELAERAVRLNPDFPAWAASPFAWAFFTVGRYEDTIAMLDRLAPENYTNWRWAARAGSLAALGRSKEASDTVKKAREFFPDITIEGLVDNLGLTDSEVDRWVETMKLAGFPPCAAADKRAKLASNARLAECG